MVFLKNWLFLITFADSGNRFRPPGKVFLGMSATTAFYMSIGLLWGRKCSFENFFVFFNLFQTGGECFLPSGKMFLYDSQNYFRRVQRHTFRENHVPFEQKNLCFYHFRRLNESFSGSRPKRFWLVAIFVQQGFQNCLLLVLKNSWMEHFFSRKEICNF